MAEIRRDGDDPALSDRSIAELLRQLSDQTATLVRQELALARTEVALKGRQTGLGAGMFGGAAMFGLYALGALTACVILALATAIDGWLAALILAAAYAVIAGALALAARAKVRAAVPPVPAQAVESVKEDVQWTKRRAREGRR
jgi:hypothetical protein